MAIFIDPQGHTTFGIGICDRCSRKFPLDELYSDPNTPGLKVCIDDMDQYDPYRLPARQTEDITLRFVRPDVPVDDLATGQVHPGYGLMGVIAGQNFERDDTLLRITEDGNIRVQENAFRDRVNIE